MDRHAVVLCWGTLTRYIYSFSIEKKRVSIYNLGVRRIKIHFEYFIMLGINVFHRYLLQYYVSVDMCTWINKYLSCTYLILVRFLDMHAWNGNSGNIY